MPSEHPTTLLNGCPKPHVEAEVVQLAHGGGGRKMRSLIADVIGPPLGRDVGAEPLHDAAILQVDQRRLAFTTDSFVVDPLFFPGGDIGKLAVCGTVNDLAMAGAQPQCLSCGLILEEGTPIELVQRVMNSIGETAEAVGARVVTGDTKVVDRGKADAVFINTAGIGAVDFRLDVRPQRVEPGDAVILSGDVGRHGVAILATREELNFDGVPASDCAPLGEAVRALTPFGADVHCLRDLTRGGLTSALVEIAEDAGVGVQLDEASVAIHPGVDATCELLGLDPLYVANEGRFVAFVASEVAEQAVAALRTVGVSSNAAIIGEVVADDRHDVVAIQPHGARRLLIMLTGEQLPRIC